jgi:hypothetical protein
LTLMTIAERIFAISRDAFTAFKQASAEAGVNPALFDDIEQRYNARIERERQILAGGTPVPPPPPAQG